MVRVALVGVLLGSGGCGYTIAMSSHPQGAYLDLPDGAPVVTPDTVTMQAGLSGRQVVRVTAPGYRTLEVDMRKGEVTVVKYLGDFLFHPAAVLGYETRGDVVFVLVPEHGPVGTWAEEEP